MPADEGQYGRPESQAIPVAFPVFVQQRLDAIANAIDTWVAEFEASSDGDRARRASQVNQAINTLFSIVEPIATPRKVDIRKIGRERMRGLAGKKGWAAVSGRMHAGLATLVQALDELKLLLVGEHLTEPDRLEEFIAVVFDEAELEMDEKKEADSGGAQ